MRYDVYRVMVNNHHITYWIASFADEAQARRFRYDLNQALSSDEKQQYTYHCRPVRLASC